MWDLCFFYYSARFDTLSCSIIYYKLERYGIRGVNLDFIESYFAIKSAIKCQESGVNQGSKTGPLIFYIYSSEFTRMCSNDQNTL